MSQYIQVLVQTGLNRCGPSPTQAGATTMELRISYQTTHPLSHSVFCPFPHCPALSHIKPFHQLIIFSNHSSLEPEYKKP
jgi:hypothetical protein